MEIDVEGNLIPVFRAKRQDDHAAVNTAAELDHLHNDRRYPGRLRAGDLRNVIRDRFDVVARRVSAYRDATEPHQRREIAIEICRMIAREAPFTALLRSTIQRHLPAGLLDSPG